MSGDPLGLNGVLNCPFSVRFSSTHPEEALGILSGRQGDAGGFSCPRDVPQPHPLPGMDRVKQKIHN